MALGMKHIHCDAGAKEGLRYMNARRRIFITVEEQTTKDSWIVCLLVAGRKQACLQGRWHLVRNLIHSG